MSRIVKVYSTRNSGLRNVETNVETWGELQEVLSEQNIDYIGMKATENVNSSTLEMDDAKLPEGNFMLVLTPHKTKSGVSYAELRREIKFLVDNSSEAYDHFNQGGKNYTNKKREELKRLLDEWKGVEETVDENDDTLELEDNRQDIVTRISELEDYDENSEAYDAAIEIILAPEDYNQTANVSSGLTKEELEFIEKVR